MKFSVLMSVYKNDNANYLKRAIQSVTIEQTKKPAQLVLVQDGPIPEETSVIIRNMKDILNDNRIEFTVISNKINAGLAAALNAGLKHCKYEYIARMDSDDISLPNRFEIEFGFLEEHPEISVLGGNITEFENDENKPLHARIVPQNHNQIVTMLRTRNAMNHMTIVFKKDDILKLGGYSENFGKLEDYKLWVDAASADLKLHNVGDICVNARIGSGFIERRSEKREIYDWDMLQSYLIKVGMINKKKALLNKISIRLFIYMPGYMKKIVYKMLLRN